MSVSVKAAGSLVLILRPMSYNGCIRVQTGRSYADAGGRDIETILLDFVVVGFYALGLMSPFHELVNWGNGLAV